MTVYLKNFTYSQLRLGVHLFVLVMIKQAKNSSSWLV